MHPQGAIATTDNRELRVFNVEKSLKWAKMQHNIIKRKKAMDLRKKRSLSNTSFATALG